MHVYTLVIVPATDVQGAVEAAHRVVPSAALDEGADYWTIGPLEPRLSEAGMGFAAATGVIPLELLPEPLPARLDPAAIVSAEGRWHWRPLETERARRRWPQHVERLLGPRVPGRCVVTADVHF